MGRTQGRQEGGRRDTRQDQQRGHSEQRPAARREARDWAKQTGYQPGVNQRQDEPMPASHHDDSRQEAVVRNAEHAGDGEQARPSPRAPSRHSGCDKDGDDRVRQGG
jgi:hypothetical protein